MNERTCCCIDLIFAIASSVRILVPQRSNLKTTNSSKWRPSSEATPIQFAPVAIASSYTGVINHTGDTSGLQHLKRMARTWGLHGFSARLSFPAVWVVIWAKKHKRSLRCSTTILERESRTSGTAKGPGLKSLHRSNPMSNQQSLTIHWPNHSGSSTQMATDELAKQRMPWETEPGTAKGQSLNIEHVPRRESLGCLQISDNRSAKCFETRLATHVV